MSCNSPVGQIEDLNEATFQAIAKIAYESAGLDLPLNKRAMVAARLSKRLARLAISNFEDYVGIVRPVDAPERRRMITALTTNVSHFFREPHHFSALRKTILPPLISQAQKGGRVRLWSAGCANGQEAYSIALTLLDVFPNAFEYDVRILATDIDPAVIGFARLGTYHASMATGIPPNLRDQYFTHDQFTETYSANQELRSICLFRELNLHKDWPMPGRFDVIFCRNVMIYFAFSDQGALWTRFQQKLQDNGWLLVGHSERLDSESAPELQLSGHTIYQRGQKDLQQLNTGKC